MIEENRYTVLPKVSIRPDSFTFYNRFYKNFGVDPVEKIKLHPEAKKTLQEMGVLLKKLPSSNKHNFELSHKGAKRIKEKVSWLYTLAKRQTVTTHNGKILDGFKMNFITLTLPAQQQHTTDKIIKFCLNQFLTELTTRFGLKNYVWRLEYQKNGNAHFHIACDCFLEYWQARSIWNRCLNKLGYVNEYIKASENLTFAQYCAKHSRFTTIDTKTLNERFCYGKSTKWSNPNTVDIRLVTNHKNIAFYISKYITKISKEPLNPIVAEREQLNSNMRLWFCSRSLSKLDKISLFCDEYNELAQDCFRLLKESSKGLFDYCKIYWFQLNEQCDEFKRKFRLLLFNYASELNYFNLNNT